MTPTRFDKLKQALERRQPDLTVFCDAVHKPHNVSAILRTCDAVGIGELHAVAADGDLRRHHVMAGGSQRWVEIALHRTSASCIDHLRADGWKIALAGADAGAQEFRQIDYTEKIAIVVGAEMEGPSDAAIAAADLSIRIPMYGLVESLNVSVATAIILFEAERQRVAAGMYDACRIAEPNYSQTLFQWAHPDIAARCDDRGIDYPRLTDDGDLAENPFN